MKTAVLLRYGTFNRPATPIMSIKKVAMRVGKARMPLYRRLKEYEKTGRFVLKKKWGFKPKIDKNLEAKICDRFLLQEWAPYSLHERL